MADFRASFRRLRSMLPRHRRRMMSGSPGTVSKILWHFTGGPNWDAKTNRQKKRPKPTRQAYEILVKILEGRELKIGKYKEVIRFKELVSRTHDEESGSWFEGIGPTRRLDSDPVCCLADIPIVHLGYHAERYGKVAIGFHRESALRHGFNPVFYQLHFPRKPIGEQAPLTKSRHLTCVAGNYLSPGPSGRRRGNYSSELSGRSELPFGRRQTVQRAGGLPRRSSPGPAGPLTCRCRKIGADDALPSRRRFCVSGKVQYQVSHSEVLQSIYASRIYLEDAYREITVELESHGIWPLLRKMDEDSSKKRFTNAVDSIDEVTTYIKGSLQE